MEGVFQNRKMLEPQRLWVDEAEADLEEARGMEEADLGGNTPKSRIIQLFWLFVY
jgi:hypothetical protein